MNLALRHPFRLRQTLSGEGSALSQILRHNRLIGEPALARALALPPSPYALSETLAAENPAHAAAVSKALGRQRGLGFVDLDARPPDPALLSLDDVPRYLSHGLLPWRRTGAVVTYAVVDPTRAPQGLSCLGARPALCCAVLVTRAALERAIVRRFGTALAERAAHRTPAPESVRSLGHLRRVAILSFVLVLGWLVLGGETAILSGLAGLCLINTVTAGVRVAAVVAGSRFRDTPPRGPPALHEPGLSETALPMVSILVPLYREAHMIPQIVAALARLDYPRERLDVRLLLEEDDSDTRTAAREAALPGWVSVVVVPAGRPRTKPRAMNYALDFCRGEIVGIFDAEDHPASDQLRRVVAMLAAAPREVAAVQCQLAYHNGCENWLSRCFQIEYAIWFDVLLRGFEVLGLPIPLGGTSVFFRRDALISVGGWDAHNVTEDADLGMRLHRRGLRTLVLRSVTLEEANCRLAPWIRQRSRWLKGYLLTWLCHMRDPARLYRELGGRGFFGLNVLFGGAAVAYLAMPLFWASLVAWLFTGSTAWHGAVPGWLLWPLSFSLVVGQMVMVGCAALALRRRGEDALLWCVPTLPLYWTLGALAAWKAILELAVAPFYWDKTRHGVSRQRPVETPVPLVLERRPVGGSGDASARWKRVAQRSV